MKQKKIENAETESKNPSITVFNSHITTSETTGIPPESNKRNKKLIKRNQTKSKLQENKLLVKNKLKEKEDVQSNSCSNVNKMKYSCDSLNCITEKEINNKILNLNSRSKAKEDKTTMGSLQNKSQSKTPVKCTNSIGGKHESKLKISNKSSKDEILINNEKPMRNKETSLTKMQPVVKTIAKHALINNDSHGGHSYFNHNLQMGDSIANTVQEIQALEPMTHFLHRSQRTENKTNSSAHKLKEDATSAPSKSKEVPQSKYKNKTKESMYNNTKISENKNKKLKLSINKDNNNSTKLNMETFESPVKEKIVTKEGSLKSILSLKPLTMKILSSIASPDDIDPLKSKIASQSTMFAESSKKVKLISDFFTSIPQMNIPKKKKTKKTPTNSNKDTKMTENMEPDIQLSNSLINNNTMSSSENTVQASFFNGFNNNHAVEQENVMTDIDTNDPNNKMLQGNNAFTPKQVTFGDSLMPDNHKARPTFAPSCYNPNSMQRRQTSVSQIHSLSRRSTVEIAAAPSDLESEAEIERHGSMFVCSNVSYIKLRLKKGMFDANPGQIAFEPKPQIQTGAFRIGKNGQIFWEGIATEEVLEADDDEGYYGKAYHFVNTHLIGKGHKGNLKIFRWRRSSSLFSGAVYSKSHKDIVLAKIPLKKVAGKKTGKKLNKSNHNAGNQETIESVLSDDALEYHFINNNPTQPIVIDFEEEFEDYLTS